jgi:pyruvate/2-oxoglutarate dehydrogenase complex dihydrolipoamide dehydrogenase (E3) component
VAEVTKILREDGVDILLNARTQKAELVNGVITLTVTVEGKEQTIEGTDLLMAAGRVPNTSALNLAAAGIETDERGFIRANERLETTAPGVWVLGDVKGGPQFTHISYDDYRILKANLFDGGHRTVHDRMVPYTVFMDPQLGRVGMTETEAKKSGKKIRVARMPMTWVARALEMDESRGLMKAIVDADSEEILGVTVLGVEGGEVMSVFQMAMMGHLKWSVLQSAVIAHPTLAESINNLFLHFDDEN